MSLCYFGSICGHDYSHAAPSSPRRPILPALSHPPTTPHPPTPPHPPHAVPFCPRV